MVNDRLSDDRVTQSTSVKGPELAHTFRWTFDRSASKTGPSAYDGFPPLLDLCPAIGECLQRVISTGPFRYRNVR
jgi:hypothetical protein